MRGLIRRISVVIVFSALFLVSLQGLLANSAGNLAGVVRDQDGNPRPGLLISLVDLVSRNAIPLLTTTDKVGQIYVRNVTEGSYQLVVKSSLYQGPFDRLVEVRPGETAVISLVVQEILGLRHEVTHAAGVAALLRGSANRRLIFRGLSQDSDPEGQPRPFFKDGVFEVYTSAGLGSDLLVFPGNASHGTTTNFGARDRLPDGTEYIFAGQFNSGNDSLFRIKNWLNHDLGKNHQLRLLMGYGRVAFAEPSLALLNNPSLIAGEDEYLRTSGTTKILTLGFEDSWQVAPGLSFMWGAEMNQVRRRFSNYFVSPNARVTYQPTSATSVQMSVSSKRDTLSNSISLPGGERMYLNDAIHLSSVRDQVRVGTARHYEASISHQLSDATKLQVAAFDSRLMGTAPHLLTRFPRADHVEFLDLNASPSRTKGYRLTVNHRIRDNIRAALSYVRGSGPSIDPINSRHVFVDASTLGALFRQHGFHALAAELETYVPQSETRITAVLRAVPSGQPITAVDPIADIYETPNRSINLFIRQLVPVPVILVRFLGLNFLKEYRLEALLDIRNLLNEDLGSLPSSGPDLILVQQPRSLRGGLAVNF